MIENKIVIFIFHFIASYKYSSSLQVGRGECEVPACRFIASAKIGWSFNLSTGMRQVSTRNSTVNPRNSTVNPRNSTVNPRNSTVNPLSLVFQYFFSFHHEIR